MPKDMCNTKIVPRLLPSPSPRSDGDMEAFDLVSRSELFKILKKVGCPPPSRLLAIIQSFHDMQSTVCYHMEQS